MGCMLLFGCLVALLGSHGMQGENYDEEISVSKIVKRYTTVRQLSVIAIEAPPYVIVRKTARGDNHFEGFTVDLLDAVCARISCRYKIYMSEDGIGSTDTGMIGEVHRGAADLALGPIAMTRMRGQAVDFSIPWLDAPLSVLIRRDAGITSLKELLDQETIRYGISISGVAMSKFMGTKEEPYSRMAVKMSRNPNVYVSSVDTGLSRVLSENYSLILDKPTAEYMANKHCELTSIGEFLDDGQGYGFPLTKGDRLIPAINDALRAMKHDGAIMALYKKWWKVDNCRPERVGAVSGAASLPLGFSLCAAIMISLGSVSSLL